MKNTKVNPAKASLVTELKDVLKISKSVAVVDYKGLKVSQATDLRRAIKKAGGQVVVTKNTLFSLAASQTYNQPTTAYNLSGTSAFIFSVNDEVSAIKAIADFAKLPTSSGLPVFKMGLLADKVLTKDEIMSLASLPTKDVLIAKTLGSLNSPIFGLVYNLNWSLSQLVRTLDAVRSKKGGDN